jgi:hypothetical protein
MTTLAGRRLSFSFILRISLRLMKILKMVGLFSSGFITAGIAVGLWCGYLFSRLTVAKEVEVAAQAAEQAEWLAELRLGETTNTIQSLENVMDIGVFTISQWAELRSPDEKTRKARDAFLKNVKVYHQSYPVTGADTARITALLATVPGRGPQSTCKAGICRLDDLRLAKLQTNTNSPAGR